MRQLLFAALAHNDKVSSSCIGLPLLNFQFRKDLNVVTFLFGEKKGPHELVRIFSTFSYKGWSGRLILVRDSLQFGFTFLFYFHTNLLTSHQATFFTGFLKVKTQREKETENCAHSPTVIPCLLGLLIFCYY